jgi:hypothetical protein
MDTVFLRFSVSRDEEHVEMTAVYQGRDIPLEAREHGYLIFWRTSRVGWDETGCCG